MSVNQLMLTSGTINVSTEVIIYTNSQEQTVQPFLILTNGTSAIITVEVFLYTPNILIFDKKSIPAGVGMSIFFDKLANARLNQSHQISLKADSANAFNYFLSGIEFDFT